MPFYPEVKKLAKIKELFARFKQENDRISSSEMSRCSGSLRESMLLSYASKHPSHASLESKRAQPAPDTRRLFSESTHKSLFQAART